MFAREDYANELKEQIAYARWAGCSKCCINVETARYILALLSEVEGIDEKSNNA